MSIPSGMRNGEMVRTSHPAVKETTELAPLTEYILPLESPQNRVTGHEAERPRRTFVTDFAELEDGTLIDLVEDPSDMYRTMLAVWKDGKVEYRDEFDDEARIIKAHPRISEVHRAMRLPKAVCPYESTSALLDTIEALISRCVALDRKYIRLLADFVLCTWFVDRLPIAPYVSVIGLPQSGKTTLLKVLSLICRRPLLVANITPASLYKACAQFCPTVLIDEASTISHSPIIRHLLRTGTTRDGISVKGDQVFHSYGAKVISWLEPPDDPALNSRCILVPMFESSNSNLAKPTDPEIERLAFKLQAQLLQFRFENVKKIHFRPIPEGEILRPRSRDILCALSAVHLQNSDRTKELVDFFKTGEAIPQEPLSAEQNAVLRALFAIIHSREGFCSVQTRYLTNAVNYFLERAGEPLRLLPRKVGAVVKSLGFSNRKRTYLGWTLSLSRSDFEKIHQLAECYGLENMSDSSLVSIAPRMRFMPSDGQKELGVRSAFCRGSKPGYASGIGLSMKPATLFVFLNVMNIMNVVRHFREVKGSGRSHKVENTKRTQPCRPGIKNLAILCFPALYVPKGAIPAGG